MASTAANNASLRKKVIACDELLAKKAQLGIDSAATGGRSVALGAKSLSSGLESIAIGDDAQATNEKAIAIGDAAVASALTSIAVGTGAIASATSAVCIGDGATSEATSAVAVGTGVGNDVASSFRTYGIRTTAHGSVTAAGDTAICNAWAGKVTNDSVLGAGTAQNIAIANNLVTATSVILVSIQVGATEQASVWVTNVGAGTFTVRLLSTAGTAAAPIVHFCVLTA